MDFLSECRAVLQQFKDERQEIETLMRRVEALEGRVETLKGEVKVLREQSEEWLVQSEGEGYRRTRHRSLESFVSEHGRDKSPDKQQRKGE